MIIQEYIKENYRVTSDSASTNIEAVVSMLSRSYWASSRPREVIKTSIKNSCCFNLFDGERQIGFARMVTDYSTFGFLCDVVVEEDYRGRGLGKWLMECVMSHPVFKNIRIIQLITRDAQELYRKYGFNELANPQNHMIRFIQQ